MVAMIAILPMVLISCHDEFKFGISGQGEIVRETASIENFDGFISAIAADIYVRQGDTLKVEIEAQENIIDNIDLDKVIDGIWTIHYREMVRYSKPVKIYITMPTLTLAGISGSGKIEGITRFKNLDELNLVISGSGNINLETETKHIDALISGSGEMLLSGNTDKLSLLLSGSGGFRGTDLLSPKAEATISGSGSARINAQDQLNALISGSGSVYYTGNPELNVHVSGSGTVKRQ